jgi:GNAT superfamily N-acetyltransferase
MNLPLDRSSIRVLPRKFFNKTGELLRLELLSKDAHGRLLAMYLAFQPRNCFQGLPPIRDEVCVKWIHGMIETGVNLLAESAPGEVVGHAAIFPINPRKCELLVVVSHEHQNTGIGTELVRGCIAVAAELDFERIWLPVEAKNIRARRVYEKCGFAYVSPPGHELDMVCELKNKSPLPPGEGQGEGVSTTDENNVKQFSKILSHAPILGDAAQLFSAEGITVSNG